MQQGAVTQDEPHQSPSVLFEHREQHKRQRRGFHRHSPLWLLRKKKVGIWLLRKKKVGIWVIRCNLSLVLLACRGLYAKVLSLQCRIRASRTEPQLRHLRSNRLTAIQDGARGSQEPGTESGHLEREQHTYDCTSLARVGIPPPLPPRPPQ